VADGAFLPEGAQRFGVAAEGGRVGHHLLVPLRLADGAALMVDLGFVASDAPAAVPVALETPVAGVLRYEGDDGPNWLTPDNEPAAGLWFWYDLPALRAATGLELLPVVLDASPDAAAGAALPNNHLGYAITWYGLAAALVAFYVGLGLRRREERA
jgi:surfeit locus 1 family protein